MNLEQIAVAGLLGLTFLLFLHGRWRYDVVAMGALLVLVLAGIVPEEAAFSGFGHPAVITVASILVVSRGLRNSGVVDLLASLLLRSGERPTSQIAAGSGLVAVSSGFMNNVGALALFMPVALRVARQRKISPSLLLMPLAFASLLGGMVTLVGTPPNIIIAIERGSVAGQPFTMFDYAPVGGAVALAGIAFICAVGWRLLPRRAPEDDDATLFDVAEYTTELHVPDGSSVAGETIAALEREVEELVVIALVRGERSIPAPYPTETLREGDLLVVRADSETLQDVLERGDLEPARQDAVADYLEAEEATLVEAVVTPHSWIEGRSAVQAHLHHRYGVNLMAISREGARISRRIGAVRLRAGDVLMVQVPSESARDVLARVGLLPLAERGFRLRQPPRVLLAASIFGSALVAAAALRLIPIEVAVTAAAGAMVVTGIVSLEEIYESVDWPVIVLLAAMIPVGGAIETTGIAGLIASQLVALGGDFPLWALVALLLVSSMVLSDVINNAAAAVVMAPIAISTAEGVGASADPFLMAVALGASCAFLTPIGHQSNVLVMGPGGYRFGDYWRMGLPLEMVIVAIGVPLLMLVWPP